MGRGVEDGRRVAASAGCNRLWYSKGMGGEAEMACGGRIKVIEETREVSKEGTGEGEVGVVPKAKIEKGGLW